MGRARWNRTAPGPLQVGVSSDDQELRLRVLMSNNDGLATLDQALEHGVSREAVRRRVAAKQWFPMGYRVYQDAAHQPTPRAILRAAMLSLGDGAVLVGEGAAWWWGLRDRRPPTFEIAVERQRAPRRGAHLVRRAVPPADRTMRQRIRVTTLVPTVLDAAVDLGLVEGAALVDTALQQRRVTLDELRRGRIRRSGRPGARVLDRLMHLAEGGAVSEAERITHAQLRAAGITGWVANLPVDVTGFGRAVLDVAFAAQKVIVEVDGWAYHRRLRAFLVDGPRQTALTADGWVVVRTHWYELTQTPEVFLANLRRVLATR
jgi:very-short-patch-repair endonuclease